MPRLLGQLLPGALWPFSAGLDGRAVAAPAPCSSGFWLFLGPNSITQTRENLSPVNSIQVQGLGHQRYADSLLLIVLGPLLPHCSGASSPLTPVCTPDCPPHLFPCVSGISAFLKTLLPSGRYRDLFLIRRHPLCCILRDESVLLSVHGLSLSTASFWGHFSSFPKRSPWFEAHTGLAIFLSLPCHCKPLRTWSSPGEWQALCSPPISFHPWVTSSIT